MQKLISSKKSEAVTTSLLVAEKFEKRHSDVLKKIEQLIKNEPTQNCVRCFSKSQYIDSKGESRPMYYMTRDGFVFLAMGFTGIKANKWKWTFIDAFNQMENYIKFKEADKELQKYSMSFLSENLEMPDTKDYIKANTIANKCVSILHGYSKMMKKSDMPLEMLKDREPILKDVVELMVIKEKFNLDISVSESIRMKYAGQIAM